MRHLSVHGGELEADNHAVNDRGCFVYHEIIDDICCLQWELLDRSEILQVAHAYYYFSVQFRESLEVAIQIFPDDPNLLRLYREECDTDNLSPWPRVAGVGEKLNHDEFVRRVLQLEPLYDTYCIADAGSAYLSLTQSVDPISRALSIVSYENGGLSKIFTAVLGAPDWSGQGQQAFRHFLEKHLMFDSDPDEGHGALCQHFKPDDRVAPLWAAFKELLITSVPTLTRLLVAERGGGASRGGLRDL